MSYTNFYLALFFILTSALFMSSCSEEPDDTTIIVPMDTLTNRVQYLLNGGGFSNRFVQYSDFVEAQTGVWYDAASGSTTIRTSAKWNGQIASLHIVVPGGVKDTTYVFEDPDFVFEENKWFDIIVESSRQLYVDNYDFVNITIEEYGEVGELVKGTFFGGFEEAATNAHIQVNNGQFEIIRQQ